MNQATLKVGDINEEVSRLRNYLMRFGYLSQSSPRNAELFDERVQSALERVQSIHRLAITGQLDSQTRQLIDTPRCGNSDDKFELAGAWPKTALTYHVTRYTAQLTNAQVDAALLQAFAKWSDVSPLRFTNVTADQPADIDIQFVTGDHGDGTIFDGTGKVLAHASYPPPFSNAGYVHFDDAENWTVPSSPNTVSDLVSVAIHEIGHAIGLAHSPVPDSVMYSTYPTGTIRNVLQPDDVAGVRALYVAWERLPGGGSDVAVGANGSAWIVGTDDGIYEWVRQHWVQRPGGATRIAVGPTGSPWITNSRGDIYEWLGGSFQRRPGGATDIGIGANGAVWIVGTDGGIYEWIGQNWVQRPGGATRIAVGPTGSPWITNSRGDIYEWSGGSFQRRPGGADDIGIGADGSIWIIGTDAAIYRWNGTGIPTESWSLHPGSGSSITVDPLGKPWITNNEGQIFRRP